MKAARVSPGSWEGLALRDEPVPSPGRHEVLIRIHAASLNFRDIAFLKGEYPVATKDKVIPLSDGAGEVVALGEDVTRVKTGDRVSVNCLASWIGGPDLVEYGRSSVGFTIDGVLAEYAVFYQDALVPLPPYMSYAEAASLPCAAVTAWTSLNLLSPLQPGQTVLVQGTGGVALFALQVAKMFGARVLAITSSDDKASTLKELGAEAVVNYTAHPDWDREIIALTGGQGVDKVMDIAGEKTIVKSAAAARRRGGEVIVVGFASGFGGGLPPIDILTGGLRVTGTHMGPRSDFEAMLKAMALHQVHPVIDRVYPLTEVREAYARVESGKQVGKVVIDISGSAAGRG